MVLNVCFSNQSIDCVKIDWFVCMQLNLFFWVRHSISWSNVNIHSHSRPFFLFILILVSLIPKSFSLSTFEQIFFFVCLHLCDRLFLLALLLIIIIIIRVSTFQMVFRFLFWLWVCVCVCTTYSVRPQTVFHYSVSSSPTATIVVFVQSVCNPVDCHRSIGFLSFLSTHSLTHFFMCINIVNQFQCSISKSIFVVLFQLHIFELSSTVLGTQTTYLTCFD